MIFNTNNIVEKIKKIKAIIFDIDGVMTDGGIIYNNKGVEYKKFNVKDGQIVSYMQKYGFIIGAISGRDSQVVKNRCEELKLNFHKHGVKNKLIQFENFKKIYKLENKNILYIGDDIIDLSILKISGVSATPKDSREYIKKYVDIVTDTKGGEGVFRDIADYVLDVNNLLNSILE